MKPRNLPNGQRPSEWLNTFQTIADIRKVKDLENQIDVVVYKLYELTYEEVKIVDPVFALTEDEYENFKI